MRIAVVNDLVIAVEAMRRIVESSADHKLAWVARDGVEAIERCAADRPDLILMDLIMPRLDGVEATRQIMAKTPCAIVVVTANVNENSRRVFEAMGAGALDAVNTPVLERSKASEGAKALLAKVETIRKLIGAARPATAGPAGSRSMRAPFQAEGHVVVIGASAGGPAALARILSHLGRDFPASVVIVQHVDVKFADGLAHWLDYQSQLEVRLAREGDRPRPGIALLAGQENHLAFSAGARLTYTPSPMDCPYRPSVDVLFKSANRYWMGEVTGVLLTGMGRDGAEGLRLLKSHGHHTIAQDRQSSAVYGMPGAAAELHAATEILALDKIAGNLTNIVLRTAKMHA